MCLSTSCIPLFSYVRFHPLASPQLLAFMLFQYPNFSCAPVPLSNPLHAFGFNISAPPVPQQLLALTWFHYLTSPLCLSSNFFNFLRTLGFNIYTLQGVQGPSPCDTLRFPPPSHFALFFSISTLHTSVPHLGAFTWLQYLNFPPLVPLTNFLQSVAWSQDFTSGLLTTFCMHLNLVSMSKLPPCLSNFLHSSILPPQPPHNFLRSFCLISKLPPRCPTTTSCIHLASIFPVPLSNFLHSFDFISGSTVAP